MIFDPFLASCPRCRSLCAVWWPLGVLCPTCLENLPDWFFAGLLVLEGERCLIALHGWREDIRSRREREPGEEG